MKNARVQSLARVASSAIVRHADRLRSLSNSISRVWPSDLPTYGYLILIALILLLPSLLFTTYLLSRFHSNDRHQSEQRLRQTAEAVADDIDRDIEGIKITLRTLAISGVLAQGNFAEFHRLALDALSGTDLALIVIDPSLIQRVNTMVPFGTAPHKTGDPPTALKVLATKKPQVSDLFISLITGKPTLNVAVPVMRNGEVRYILLMVFTPDRTLKILRGQNLPKGWVSGVSDSKGIVIARSLLHEKFVNTSLPPDLFSKRDRADVFTAQNLAGEPVVRAVVPMKQANWVVAATVPLDIIEASARESWRLAAMFGLGLFGLSALLAFFFGRILSRSIAQTATAAAALGRGESIVTSPSPIREANAVSASLHAASAELRQRALADAHLAAIVRSSQEAIVGFTVDGIVTSWNAGAQRVFGYTADEIIGRPKSQLLPSERQDELGQFMSRLRAGETMIAVETERRRKDGTVFPALLTVSRVASTNDELIGFSASLTDITARKAWEKRQQVLTHELAHRVKNAFAVLQSIARRTLSSSPNPAAFSDAFTGRLRSMAAAHDTLTADNWEAAELGALARTQLASYGSGDDPRVQISGPGVHLPPELAVPIGLALHELATNASKYGALSAPHGTVEITWSVQEREEGSKHLFLTWQERNGPPITAEPTHRGFGSMLIENNLPQAKVCRRFEVTGLICTIELPLTQHTRS